MKDDFLYKNRPPLRKAFSDNLYQQLVNQNPLQITTYQEEIARSVLIRKYASWKLIPVVLLAITIITFTLSGNARASAIAWIKSIAGFIIEEQSVSPLTDVDWTAGTVYPIPTLSMSIILKNPPFQFELPTWLPEGYEPNPIVAMANSKSWVALHWENPQRPDIELLVEKGTDDLILRIGENSSEEIKINGQPALLIRGNWNLEKWDPYGGLTIGWVKDELTYRLSVHSHLEGDINVLVSQLVKMAQSIQ